jgi:Uncharacterized proteins, homologs of microcin C7 resistance protein MccF
MIMFGGGISLSAQVMPKLQAGDTIAIVAPAAPVTPKQVETSVQFLQSNGFNVIVSPQIFLTHNGFAGTVRQRVEAFQQMLDRPGVKAILCARGGYGTANIIDSLDFTEFRKHPKWICGFSDITVLLTHLLSLGYPSLHSPMSITMLDTTTNKLYNNTLIQALRGDRLSYTFPADSLNRPGAVTAPVVGGNLSLLYALQGSVSDLNTDGKILYIEDVDENIYHIDRMLHSLERAGKFKNLKGLIVGCMSRIRVDDYFQDYDVNKLVAEICAKYDFPVCYNFPAGHCRPNYTLIIGRTATLKVTNTADDENECTLSFE